MLRSGLVAVVAAGILLVVGFMEWRVARQSSAQPEEISLRDAIVRGVNGNPNIILKDFQLCENFVYEEKGGRWTKIWIPVVPAAPGGPPQMGMKPASFDALIFSIQVANLQELGNRCNVPRLRALITNKIVSLGSQEKNLLQSQYPNTDFTRCLIIQEGREPAGFAKLGLMLGGGGLTLLAGVGLLIGAWVQHQGESAPKTKKKKRKIMAQLDDEPAELDEAVEVIEDEPKPKPKPKPGTAASGPPRRKPAAPEPELIELEEIVEDLPPAKPKPKPGQAGARPRPKPVDDDDEPPRPKPRR